MVPRWNTRDSSLNLSHHHHHHHIINANTSTFIAATHVVVVVVWLSCSLIISAMKQQRAEKPVYAAGDETLSGVKIITPAHDYSFIGLHIRLQNLVTWEGYLISKNSLAESVPKRHSRRMVWWYPLHVDETPSSDDRQRQVRVRVGIDSRCIHISYNKAHQTNRFNWLESKPFGPNNICL